MTDKYTPEANKANRNRNRRKKISKKSIVREQRIHSAVPTVRSSMVSIDDEMIVDLRSIKRASDIETE